MSLELLWTASWQGGIALLAAWVICRSWQSMPARAKCWVWRIAYLKLLTALVWTLPLRLPILQAQSSAPIAQAIPVKAPLARRTPLELPAAMTPISLPPPQEQPVNRWLMLLLILWCGGLGVAAWRLARQWWWARDLRQRCRMTLDERTTSAARRLADRVGLRTVPPIMTGEPLAGPMLLGLFRPAIVLPQAVIDGPRPQLEMVLAHELAHVKRRDLSWNLPPALAEALFFFHPLVWLAQRELRLAQEMACDQLALDITRCEPAAYAGALLEIAQRGCPPALAFASGVVGPRKSLYTRILAMKTLHTWSRPRLITSAVLAFIIAVAAIPPWRVVAQERQGGDQPKTPEAKADSKPPEAKAGESESVVHRLQGRRTRTTHEFLGVLSAAKVQLSPAADGAIKSVNAKSGDRVKTGDLLLQLDDRRARAGVAIAEARLKVLEVAIQNAQKDKEIGIGAGVRAMQEKAAELEVAKAELSLSMQDLDETRIIAPFDGVVQIRAMAGQRVAKGESLGQLVQEGKLKVEFSVATSMLRQVKTGAQLKLRAVSDSDKEFQAKISSISPVVDSATGTVAVEADVIGDAAGLLSGMAVRGVVAAPDK